MSNYTPLQTIMPGNHGDSTSEKIISDTQSRDCSLRSFADVLRGKVPDTQNLYTDSFNYGQN